MEKQQILKISTAHQSASFLKSKFAKIQKLLGDL